ncbi:hypothetical protein BgiBS90_035648, partial [Biomphalaria glabrata]
INAYFVSSNIKFVCLSAKQQDFSLDVRDLRSLIQILESGDLCCLNLSWDFGSAVSSPTILRCLSFKQHTLKTVVFVFIVLFSSQLD